MCYLVFLWMLIASLAADELPSWNEGAAKNALLQFVRTAESTIPLAERIAVFDEDGTLWVEQPLYPEFIFALDTLQEKEPFKTALDGNLEKMMSLPKAEIHQILEETHAGMTVQAFHQRVQAWLSQALHPRFKKHYTELIYQPMLEVMQLLRRHGFKIYIVSGGGQEFIRAFALQSYGIEPEYVIGTAGKVKYTYKEGRPVLMKLPALLFLDDKAGKPEAISLMIGKHPAAAFGNSTGDQQMLEWTQARKGPSLQMLVHHDDAIREYAYGPESKVGTFSEALMQEAHERGWIVISMKKDWKVIFK